MATRLIKGNTPGSRKSGLSKTEFTQQVVQEEFAAIMQEQGQAIQDFGLFKSGEMFRKRHFSVSVVGPGVIGTLAIVPYLRFLDMKNLQNMKRRKQYHLYNRIVFGHLYGSMLKKLAFGYTEDIKNQIVGEFDI